MENDTTEMSVEEILSDTPVEERETLSNQEEETAPQGVQEEKPDKDKEFQTLEAQKRHWREKAEKLEKQLSQQTTGGTDPMEAVRLGKALADLTPEETDEAVIRAKGRFNTLKPTPDQIIKAIQDEQFKLSIEAGRKKLADSKKIPGSSSPDFARPTKNYQDIAKMSKEQFRDYAQKQEQRGGTGI